MLPVICFTSDFGLDDTWVGVCHAVIYQGCAGARVVDLSHGVPPYDVRKGASVAASGVHQLPDAIHLVVVDPGVGGGRRDLCVVTKGGTTLIGPDNGVLLPAAARSGGVAAAYLIEPSRFSSAEPAPTFRARDVLAPAAAAVACGTPPASLGPRIEIRDLIPAPFGEFVVEGEYVLGEVLEADRFGSLRFNIPTERLDELGLRSERLEVELGHNALDVPFGRTFSDVGEGEPVALVDGSGWLTLAVNQGNAGDRYGAIPGVRVRVRAL